MKLKYIFTALVAALTFAVGCEDSIETYLDAVKVSSSYVAIPATGGKQTITVDAKYDWAFGEIPEWVKVNPTSGTSGECEITFSADTAASTREAMLYLNCDGKQQIINVLQMTEKVDLPITECGEVNKNGVDGKTYRVKGTVTSIANTLYGNMYVTDATGSAYVYGTLDKNGGEKNFSSLGIEVGDIVVVEGPRKTYNGTVELVNVTVISIEKSLIKVDSVSVKEPLPLEGGEFKAYLTCKGEGVSVSVPDDAKSWLSVTSIETSGTNATVTFNASRNDLGDRSTTLAFNTTFKGKTYSAQADLEQKGAIIETTINNILAAEDGLTQYRTTGYITKDNNSDYGNIYIKDATGEIYVYGVLDDKGQSKQWKSMGINVGDIVTVVGPKTSYNGTPQLKNVTIEKHIAVKDISIADFRALPDDKTAYYRISGKVAKSTEANTKFDLATYGNFALADGSAEIYVYGVVPGWGGASKQFATLGVNEGDELTIVGYKTSYNGLNQVGGAFYVSHKAGGAEPEVPVPGDDVYSIDLKYTLGKNGYDDGVATINGKEDCKVLKIGKSSEAGEITLTVPAGTKSLTFYAVAWKGKPATLALSGAVTAEIALKANDGATGNTPYASIIVTDEDKYEVKMTSALAADTELKVTTTGSNTRAIFFGVKAHK